MTHWSLQHPEAVLIAAGGMAGGVLGMQGGLVGALLGAFAGVFATVLIAAMGDPDVPPTLGPHH
jgi:hypothetical protein